MPDAVIAPNPLFVRCGRQPPPLRWRTLAGAALLACGTCTAADTAATLSAAAVVQVETPAFMPMAATGPQPRRQAIDVVDFEWTDAARHREVPARLYWPAGADGGAPVPLVVFSHGLGGSRYGYSHLGRYWAEHGYASLHLQHTGSDRAVWSSDLWKLYTNLQAAASEANVVARARDVSFGISALLAEPRFAGHVDADHIAVAGHSYGANTAMLVAGASVQREIAGVWRPLQLRDPRVKAAIILSAPPFYREGDMKAILRGIDIPTLHVTGTADEIKVPGYGSSPADRIAVFDATPGGPGAAAKALAVFNGATHSIFTDRIDGAAELNRVVKTATQELSVEFLNATLHGASFAGVTDWLARSGSLLARQVAPNGTN